jgi:hypothetical protein
VQVLKLFACRFFVFWVTPPIIVTLVALGFSLRSAPIMFVVRVNNRVAQNLSKLLGMGDFKGTRFEVPRGQA